MAYVPRPGNDNSYDQSIQIPDVSEYGSGLMPYQSFAGSDIKMIAVYRPFRQDAMFNARPVTAVLADVQTLSISTYREKQPVRGLGTIGVKGYTRGPRTVAGSLIFTLFNKDVLHDALTYKTGDIDSRNAMAPDDDIYRYTLIDQMPPFDIIIMMTNEYGYAAKQVLWGVEVASTGTVMSIEDLFTEKTCQYVAHDLSPLMPINEKSFLRDDKGDAVYGDGAGSSALPTSGVRFNELLSSGFARNILSKTRNPFK